MTLKELLAGLDNAAEVEKVIKANLRDEGCKLFIDDGEENIYVPKKRLDAKIAELSKAKETINDLQDQVDSDTSASTIKQLQSKVAQYEKQINDSKISDALKDVLSEFNPVDAEDIKAFLKLDEVQVSEKGDVLGLEGIKTQLTELKEKKSYLFNAKAPEGGNDNKPSFFGTGAPGKPSNTNIFGSKTTHAGDFGKSLAEQINPNQEGNVVDSDYFFKK